MDASKVDAFISANGKYFHEYHLNTIRDKLVQMDDYQWYKVQYVQFKDPVINLIISLLFGGLGVDRFMVGDTGLGVLKLLTCGGAYIWTIIDWFQIMKITKQKNWEKLLMNMV